MTSRIPVRLVVAAALLAVVAACSRKATVGSPGPTATPAANRAPAMPAGVTPASIAEGKTLFEAQANNCTRCHGADGKGGTRGPNLLDSVWVQIDGSYPEIVRIINEGVPAAKIKNSQYQFPMAPKGRATLTDAQVGAIAAYIWSGSHPR
jgi:mono/diheme cytochrome c family protein